MLKLLTDDFIIWEGNIFFKAIILPFLNITYAYENLKI